MLLGDCIAEASVDCALPQLAMTSEAGNKAALRNVFFMLFGTPSRDFCARLGSDALVAGVDEAGRGPLAGPVVAAAVVLCKPRPKGISDSKKLGPEAREKAEEAIRRRCAFGIGVVDVEAIDRLNIFAATMLAMTTAMHNLCKALGQAPQLALVDGNLTPQGREAGWCWPARAIVGGDDREPCIGAASIIAKTYRDRLMCEAALEHPHYRWESNKGYGTRDHLEALRAHGPSPLHRRSFAPVAQYEMPL
jgi:ribonuclease HII